MSLRRYSPAESDSTDTFIRRKQKSAGEINQNIQFNKDRDFMEDIEDEIRI